MPEEQFTVELREAESQYVLLDHGAGEGEPRVIGAEVYVDVPTDDGSAHRVMYHTRVSDEYGGQGLASKLVRSAVEDAIAAGYGIVPVCPYVEKWLGKHPEFADDVVKPSPTHLQSIPRN